MDFDDVMSYLGQKLKNSNDLVNQGTAPMIDKLQMAANPNMQGPQQDNSTNPSSLALSKAITNSLPMGTVAPKIASFMAPATEEAIANAANNLKGVAAPAAENMGYYVAKQAAAKTAADTTANLAEQGIADATQRAAAQNALSRAADMAQRNQNQLALRKLRALMGNR